ncbi:MAG: carbohydrate ABC transporter permease [Monoglobaceae bacterium]
MTLPSTKRLSGSIHVRGKKYKKDTVFWSYVMISTELIGFLFFTLYPILWALRLSWFSYDGIPSNTRFIGWDNFVNIFTNDVTYWKAVLTTFQFALIKIPIEIPFALFLAVILSKKFKGTGFFRTMFFMPNVVSIAIVGLVFSNMFSHFGVINSMLSDVGIIKEGIDWFDHKWTSLAALAFTDTWHTFGVNLLYFLSALSNISEEIYESARLDGAGRFTTFFKITLPCIAPVFQVILMMSIVGTLGTSDIILVMTNGAPAGQTFTVMPYMTSKFVPGFADSSANIGYGCAVSVITALIMVAITLVYNKLSKRISSIY